jgi:TetR/AcrR family transcriptional regulator, transcriptional repressor for nem operon
MLERGLGVSVADVMGAAGLTHGGFYKHFESKDELTAVACTNAFAEAAEDWESYTAETSNGATARESLVENYLTSVNRAAPGEGCPMAALATDVSRSADDSPVREAFHQGFEHLVDILTKTQSPGSAAGDQRKRALGDISAMVGALVLARATAGSGVSNEIMAATRRALLGDQAPEDS